MAEFARKRKHSGSDGDQPPKRRPNRDRKRVNYEESSSDTSESDDDAGAGGGVVALVGDADDDHALARVVQEDEDHSAALALVAADSDDSDDSDYSTSDEEDEHTDRLHMATDVIVDTADLLRKRKDFLDRMDITVRPLNLQDRVQRAYDATVDYTAGRIVFVGNSREGKSFIINLQLYLTVMDPAAYRHQELPECPEYMDHLRAELKDNAGKTLKQIEQIVSAVEEIKMKDDTAQQHDPDDLINLIKGIESVCTGGLVGDSTPCFLLPSSESGESTTAAPIHIRYGKVFHVLVEYEDEEWCYEQCGLYLDRDEETEHGNNLDALKQRYECLDENPIKPYEDGKEHIVKLRKEVLSVAGRKKVFIAEGRDADRDRQWLRQKLKELCVQDRSGQSEANHQRACLKNITIYAPCAILGNGGEIVDAPGTNDTDSLNEQFLDDAIRDASTVVCVSSASLKSNKLVLEKLSSSGFLQRLVEHPAKKHLVVLHYLEKTKPGHWYKHITDAPEARNLELSSNKAIEDSLVPLLREKETNRLTLLNQIPNQKQIYHAACEEARRLMKSSVTIMAAFPLLFASLLNCPSHNLDDDDDDAAQRIYNEKIKCTNGVRLMSLVDFLGHKAKCSHYDGLARAAERARMELEAEASTIDDNDIKAAARHALERFLPKAAGDRSSAEQRRVPVQNMFTEQLNKKNFNDLTRGDGRVTKIFTDCKDEILVTRAAIEKLFEDRKMNLNKGHAMTALTPSYRGGRPPFKLVEILIPNVNPTIEKLQRTLLEDVQQWIEDVFVDELIALFSNYLNDQAYVAANVTTRSKSNEKTQNAMHQPLLEVATQFLQSEGRELVVEHAKAVLHNDKKNKFCPVVLEDLFNRTARKEIVNLLKRLKYTSKMPIERARQTIQDSIERYITDVADAFETKLHERFQNFQNALNKAIFTVNSKGRQLLGTKLFLKLCGKLGDSTPTLIDCRADLGDVQSELQAMVKEFELLYEQETCRGAEIDRVSPDVLKQLQANVLLSRMMVKLKGWRNLPRVIKNDKPWGFKDLPQMHEPCTLEDGSSSIENNIKKIKKNFTKINSKGLAFYAPQGGSTYSLCGCIARALWGRQKLSDEEQRDIKDAVESECVLEKIKTLDVLEEVQWQVQDYLDSMQEEETVPDALRIIEILEAGLVENIKYVRLKLAVELAVNRRMRAFKECVTKPGTQLDIHRQGGGTSATHQKNSVSHVVDSADKIAELSETSMPLHGVYLHSLASAFHITILLFHPDRKWPWFFGSRNRAWTEIALALVQVNPHPLFRVVRRGDPRRIRPVSPRPWNSRPGPKQPRSFRFAVVLTFGALVHGRFPTVLQKLANYAHCFKFIIPHVVWDKLTPGGKMLSAINALLKKYPSLLALQDSKCDGGTQWTFGGGRISTQETFKRIVKCANMTMVQRKSAVGMLYPQASLAKRLQGILALPETQLFSFANRVEAEKPRTPDDIHKLWEMHVRKCMK